MRQMIKLNSFAIFGSVLLAGCNGAPAPDNVVATATPEPVAMGNTVVEEAPTPAWPASLVVIGDGFPTAGAPCRRVGESPATANYLDDSASLVGCHSVDDAAKLGGKLVGTVDGVTLISVPNSAPPTAATPAAESAATPVAKPAAASDMPAGSGNPISPGNMPAYCRGEVSGQYGTRPTYVKTGKIVKTAGGSTIDGTVDKGNEGIKAFRCRFDAQGRFVDVMAMTSDGE